LLVPFGSTVKIRLKLSPGATFILAGEKDNVVAPIVSAGIANIIITAKVDLNLFIFFIFIS